MQTKVNEFILQDDPKNEELLKRLKLSGVKNENIIQENGYLRILLEGTSLDSYKIKNETEFEAMHIGMVSLRALPTDEVYILKYRDNLICTTLLPSHSKSTFSFVSTFYGMPHENDVIFPLGRRPEDYMLQLLSLLNINATQLIVEDNQFFLKLPADVFSVIQRDENETFLLTETGGLQYELQYKGILVAALMKFAPMCAPLIESFGREYLSVDRHAILELTRNAEVSQTSKQDSKNSVCSQASGLSKDKTTIALAGNTANASRAHNHSFFKPKEIKSWLHSHFESLSFSHR